VQVQEAVQHPVEVRVAGELVVLVVAGREKPVILSIQQANYLRNKIGRATRSARDRRDGRVRGR
jgi:hypothetical protein